MPTYRVTNNEYVEPKGEEKEGHWGRGVHTIEADRMECFRTGCLGFMRGRDKAGRERLVYVFNNGEWTAAWEETSCDPDAAV